MCKKLLTKTELEKLISDADKSVKFVEKKKTSASSEWWQYYHHIIVNGHQQQFLSCNVCKTLLLFISANGTNNLRSHFKSCTKKDKDTNFVNQQTVHDFYSSSNQVQVPKQIKLSVTQACAEFCALDARAFAIVQCDGFHNLANALFVAGRRCHKSSIQIKDILPHSTTVRIVKHFVGLIILFNLIFSDQSKY
jgi:hypothetical protein